jgi:hypothetical protein
MKNYQVLLSQQTYRRSIDYLAKLKAGAIAGAYLQKRLQTLDITQVSIEDFIELLLQTKQSCIFAETEIYGNGSDWNQEELSVLGDISIATPVTVYDNGRHVRPEVHTRPFSATLIFTPGALLHNGQNLPPADWEEVTSDGELDFAKYYGLHERRLLPGLTYIDRVAKSNDKRKDSGEE